MAECSLFNRDSKSSQSFESKLKVPQEDFQCLKSRRSIWDAQVKRVRISISMFELKQFRLQKAQSFLGERRVFFLVYYLNCWASESPAITRCLAVSKIVRLSLKQRVSNRDSRYFRVVKMIERILLKSDDQIANSRCLLDCVYEMTEADDILCKKLPKETVLARSVRGIHWMLGRCSRCDQCAEIQTATSNLSIPNLLPKSCKIN